MTRTVPRNSSSIARLLSRQEFAQLDPAPEPMPCDGCAHAIMCSSRQLACKTFAQYVRTGQWNVQASPRRPSREPYKRLFRH